MSDDRTRSNWGRWGAEDQRGAANLLTEDRVLAAMRLPSKGRVYELGIELRPGAPVAGDRISPMHFMTHDGGDFAALGRDDWGTSDDYIFLATHGTSHIDALGHVWKGGQLYNGYSYREVRSSGAGRCGIERAGGLVTRAHLLDYADGELLEISGPDIDAKLSAGGAEVRPGDAVLFRTGWMAAALAGKDQERRFPVVHPSAAEWFGAHDISVVGADNQAIEQLGVRGILPPLHGLLIRDLGVYLMEMLMLDDPVADGVTLGTLVVAPLRISRGVGSPVNPLLIT